MTKRRRQTRDIPTLKYVVQAIAQWKRSDKEELLVILQAMLEVEENEQVEDERTLIERTQYRGAKGGHGTMNARLSTAAVPTCTCAIGLVASTARFTSVKFSESLNVLFRI